MTAVRRERLFDEHSPLPLFGGSTLARRVGSSERADSAMISVRTSRLG